MMLHFGDPVKLKTRRVVFEEIYMTPDPGTLEQLKELSSRRRAIEESINGSNFITEAVAREMSGGLTSRYQQDLQKLEQYFPLLENLLVHVGLVKNNPQMIRWTSDLNIRWSSALIAMPILNLMGPKFFRIDDLHFELGMTLFLYGAILRERALEILSTDLVESASLYRKAAGVYHYLAHEVLPSLEPTLVHERPPEVTAPISSIMSLICLAEAQVVTLRKAEEKGSTSGLLAKLHYGVKQFLDEAICILQSSIGERKNISPRLVEFIYSCRALHELRSQKHLAEGLRAAEQVGFAAGVLRNALYSAKGTIPGDESWQLVFKQEMDSVGEMLKKIEHENEFVWREKIPDSNELPSLEGKKIMARLLWSK